MTGVGVPRMASGTFRCRLAPLAWKGNMMWHIAHSVIRVLNFFVIVIVILILLNLLGNPISNAIPSAAQAVGDMLAALWSGIKYFIPNGWNNYYYYHH
jgi:hypothetical protein